jgi:hypothetical protein
MWPDSIVEEIQKIRQDHAAKSGYDLRAIVKDYQMRQKLCGKKIVSFVKKSEYGGTPN